MMHPHGDDASEQLDKCVRKTSVRKTSVRKTSVRNSTGNVFRYSGGLEREDRTTSVRWRVQKYCLNIIPNCIHGHRHLYVACIPSADHCLNRPKMQDILSMPHISTLQSL
jgi:hypothetical protein